ncbi:hypothetical protein IVB45_18450 [Bradyrhizobium sp. 4]|uniref:hypothetical protein n=1 Tax=unclassified Bradyrhizobium TaxID=2631580 RepID=UPI001FF9F99F|nr:MULTISPECIES: hypothetical protein [unclassified Bradyrhizobium]MCK1400103.1 hypothetical protein [Bradyrhizobium sp. 39]MCK1750393.1 hypothetical protein [Bradyrhizobium sp. 135]UPJ32002.1 hypothetical protein IVB45_18450 [Bradyrhizobium sp. 4]
MDGKTIDQNPMQMPTWSLGMAMAWIACRDIASADELWRDGLEAAWFSDEELTPNRAFKDAETTLKNALEGGSIAATGLHNGERAELTKLQWQDAKITFDWEERHTHRTNGEPGLEHRATVASGARFTGLRVNRADVLALWPTKQAEETPGKRRRGPKSNKLGEVETAMIAYNAAHGDLVRMGEEEMKTEFGASRDTCRKARARVLGSVGN